ncbi:MAG: TetR family transcriptional regulator [Mycobacterium sp.]|nr:TetR family transcriptional regulator [Mycobacterium sp.]
MSMDESATKQPTGRRSRKVQRTRSALTRSALDLFAERGFDNVTVTDIANRADVDPSTFFRHFRSKESVLFTDMDVYVARIGGLIHQRPLDEPILDTLRAITLQFVTTEGFDNQLEDLRAELTQSSAELQAQTVVRREQVVADLAELIGERLGIDHQNDPRPYLSATVWLAAFEWYRRRSVSVHRRTVDAPETLDELVAMIRSATSQLFVGPESTTPH